MKRKLLCLIMVLTLAFADLSASANTLNGEINVFADKIAELSTQERSNLLTIAYPLVIIDSGVDILITIINGHNDKSDSLIDGYITKLLKYTTKEDIVFVLQSLKIVPEDIRQEYFSALMNREEIELSDEGQEYISEFLDVVYDKCPSVERIFTDDGITDGTVAKLFTIIPAVNGDMPIVSADSKYTFAPYYISKDVADKWEALCKERGVEGDIEESVMMLSQYFNTAYPEELREKIAVLFSELGICYLSPEYVPNFKNVVMADSKRASYPAVYAYFKDGQMLFRTEMLSKEIKDTSFTDIDGWYKDCVTELAYMGVVSGRGNGLFCPNDYVTREEFVKMICSAVNLPDIDAETPFDDVDNDAWYGKYIRTAYYYKIINGQSADTFGTGKNISRQDAAVICSNILKNVKTEKTKEISFGDDDIIAPYARESVYKLAGTGVINGDDRGNFNAVSSITRAESAKIINEIIHLIAKVK